MRKRIEASLEAYRERLLPFVPGQTREEKLAKFQLLFSEYGGGVDDGPADFVAQKREQMLMEARNFFVKASLKSKFFCVDKSTIVLF